jgi:chemotaxis protein histidine kinase CheA
LNHNGSAQQRPPYARPLFICGCQRSGTTALARYLNEHEEILVTLERYKGKIRRENITMDLFAFDRIMAVSPDETDRGAENVDYLKRIHGELLARKDPAKLRWVGDKNPGYVNNLGALAKNNPGAHFIMIYRPLEEVVESWQERSRNPHNRWLYGKDGFRLGVETWNRAQRRTVEFLQSGMKHRILLLHYHDFSYCKESCVHLISRFLDLEFGEEILRTWAETSREFESRRREKDSLTAEQQAYMDEHKDHAAEAVLLERIEEQWRELDLPPGELLEQWLDEAWERMETLENELVQERRKAWRLERNSRNLRQQLNRARQSLAQRVVSKLARMCSRVTKALGR